MSSAKITEQALAEYVLSIDNGTQSVRAMLFDAMGNLHSLSRVEIEPYVSAQPGWAEQEADYYWQAVGQACQQLWRQVSIDKTQIKGVSVTTQRHCCACGSARASLTASDSVVGSATG